MIQDEAYEAVDGDIINFVFNSDYQYRVSFEEMSGSGKIKRPSQELVIEEEPKKTKCDSWASLENDKCLVFTSADCEGRSKIAAYDMGKEIAVPSASAVQLSISCNFIHRQHYNQNCVRSCISSQYRRLDAQLLERARQAQSVARERL